MKKYLLAALAVITLGAQAQTPVYLKINHLLAGQPYAFGTATSNNLGNAFNFSRTDYYLSQITLTYDGGQDTTFSDLYVLVKAQEPTNVYLGDFSFTTLEKVSFGIGVDTSMNHKDPSVLPANHPLSFQSPAMHWGWSAGYRFVAIEGKTGANYSQTWELHCLGDANYSSADISTAGTMVNNKLVIALDANYEMALKDVTVNGNLIYHGEGNVVPNVMNNMWKNVFTVGSATFSVDEVSHSTWNLYPIPSKGSLTIDIEQNQNIDAIRVMDLNGRIISTNSIEGQTAQISIDHSGVYFIQLMSNESVVSMKKCMIE